MSSRKGNLLKFVLVVNFIVTTIAFGVSTITGKVTDSETNEPLPGANIMVTGTSMGTATNIEGNYLLTNIPPGNMELKVSFIGYNSTSATVHIGLDQKITQDFKLEYKAIEGQEVVVTAQAGGQIEAINKQLSARTIVNVVSSDRIQDVPDATAAESVGRLPGVSILREGGEGNKVVIRGLSPKFNTIKIDGVKMSATGSEDRSVNLSMISPYMLDGIEVMKALTPDQDADAVGGTVNFKIRKAKTGFHYEAVAQGGYNDLRDSYNDYKFVGSVSNRFLASRLGIFAQADVEKRNRSSNQFGASYSLPAPKIGKKNKILMNSLNLNDVFREKKRYSGVVAIDYLIPEGSITLNNFISRDNTNVLNYGDSYNIVGNNRSYSSSETDNHLTVMISKLNYNQQFGAFNINSDLSYSLSEQNSPDAISWSFNEPSAFSNDIDRSAPPSLIHEYANNDIESAYMDGLQVTDQKNKEDALAFAMDFQYDLNWGNVAGMIKAGGKYRKQNRDNDYQIAASAISQPHSGDVGRNNVIREMTDLEQGTVYLLYRYFIDDSYDRDDFLNGRYHLGPMPDADLLKQATQLTVLNPALINNDKYRAYKNNLVHDYSGNERLQAAYVMMDLNLGQRIEFIPGVRYERIRTEYDGVYGDSRGGWTSMSYPHIDTTAVRKNEHWFPMVHFRVKPTDWFDVRMAYTKSVQRPNYSDLVPYRDIQPDWVNWHNHVLRPAIADNYDLYFSGYGNYVGLLTAGFFYKKINDFMYYTGTRVITDPVAEGFPKDVISYRTGYTINNEHAVTLYGVELDWQTHFWYLGGLLNGFVLGANYTHIFSDVNYPRTEIDNQYLDLDGDGLYELVQINNDTVYVDRLVYQPNDIVNLSLGYDLKGTSVRLSMFYQSNMFSGTNFWPELRQSTDEYLRWDLIVTQSLSEKLQLFMNLNNITESLDRTLVEGNDFPATEQFYGRTIDLGLRYRF